MCRSQYCRFARDRRALPGLVHTSRVEARPRVGTLHSYSLLVGREKSLCFDSTADSCQSANHQAHQTSKHDDAGRPHDARCDRIASPPRELTRHARVALRPARGASSQADHRAREPRDTGGKEQNRTTKPPRLTRRRLGVVEIHADVHVDAEGGLAQTQLFARLNLTRLNLTRLNLNLDRFRGGLLCSRRRSESADQREGRTDPFSDGKTQRPLRSCVQHARGWDIPFVCKRGARATDGEIEKSTIAPRSRRTPIALAPTSRAWRRRGT